MHNQRYSFTLRARGAVTTHQAVTPTQGRGTGDWLLKEPLVLYKEVVERSMWNMWKLSVKIIKIE